MAAPSALSSFPRWRQCRRIAWPLLVWLLLAPVFVSAENERQLKEAELKQLQAKIATLRQELQRVRSRYDALRQELGATERRIGSLTNSLRQLDGKLKQQTRRLKRLHSEQTQLQRSLEGQRRHLEGQIRAAYAMGRQEFLKILLNQEDPASVGRVLTYYDYLNKARAERIHTLVDTLHRLDRVSAEIHAETRRLEELRGRELEQKQALGSSHRERARLLERLKAEIQSKDQRLHGMQRDEKELQALIEALTEALEDIPAEPTNRKPFGKLRGELEWPAKGPLLATYGEPRNVGQLRWRGVMIKAGEGQQVKAVSHGRVAFADWLRGYGLLLIIDHGEGFMSLYGHNQSLFKETGDWVEEGEMIATVGSSGGREASGLYFEIRHNGRPTDPVRWCRR